MDYHREEYDGVELTLRFNDRVFDPTLTTTKILNRKVPIEPGARVLDVGCGVGPLAILAAKRGASEVYAVDIMSEACEYARENARINGVEDKVHVRQGDMFEPVRGEKFDVILDDVSGVAEDVARISGWYPDGIPSGGPDGTGPTIRMLTQAREYLTENGHLYFPVLSLAKAEKIIDIAQDTFGEGLEELMRKRSIPFCAELKERMAKLEVLKSQGIIDFVKRGSKHVWFLQIYSASLT